MLSTSIVNFVPELKMEPAAAAVGPAVARAGLQEVRGRKDINIRTRPVNTISYYLKLIITYSFRTINYFIN